jgi:FkbM family methyltransferase
MRFIKNFGKICTVPKFRYFKCCLSKFGLRLLREESFLKIAQASDLSNLLLRNIKFFEQFMNQEIEFNLLCKSKSQNGQEIFAYIINEGAPGYFIEVGVGDGDFLSNTNLLEKLGWKGILVEANPNFIQALRTNRTSIVEPRALYSKSDLDLEFQCDGYLSKLTVSDSSTEVFNKFIHSDKKISSNLISVKTIDFKDLLKKHKVPSLINYISIDTEGTEYEILKNFPFDSYKVKCWTVEHNYGPLRDKIKKLFHDNGYKRIFEDESLHDDFYIQISNSNSDQ